MDDDALYTTYLVSMVDTVYGLIYNRRSPDIGIRRVRVRMA